MGLGLGIRIADLNLQPNTVAVLSVFITGGQYTDSLKVVNYTTFCGNYVGDDTQGEEKGIGSLESEERLHISPCRQQFCSIWLWLKHAVA